MPHKNRSALAWITSFAVLSILTVAVVTLHAAMTSNPKREAPPDFRPISPLAASSRPLTIYSGRSESLVGEIIRNFERETGITVRIKYGSTGPLAATILEEGNRCNVDVFFAQDPGGLGLLAKNERLATLPESLLARVAYEHRDPMGRWIGVTGRLRTLAYSTARVNQVELPRSMMELTEPRWRGRIGWAPSNASFQAFITALRHLLGETEAERWIRAMLANGVRTYPSNAPIVQAIADGEIDLGLTNHYYLHRFLAERGESFPVRNHVPRGVEHEGDICGAMLLAGVAVLERGPNPAAAERFVEYLLSDAVQAQFAKTTFEYPLADGVAPHESLPQLEGLGARSVDLNQLGDLERTIELLRRTRALE